MGGLSVALAAVAAAAVVQSGDGALSPAVLSFGADAAVLQRWGSRRPAEDLVGELVRLRGHGTTDLAGGLRTAATELARVPGADERVVVLMSDCRHTAGGDPAEALAGVDRLHVLCPLPGDRPADPEAEGLAAALARRGGGLSRPVRTLADIPAALTAMLG
jgi:Mg-chelatase subunit ChlD